MSCVTHLCLAALACVLLQQPLPVSGKVIMGWRDKNQMPPPKSEALLRRDQLTEFTGNTLRQLLAKKTADVEPRQKIAVVMNIIQQAIMYLGKVRGVLEDTSLDIKANMPELPVEVFDSEELQSLAVEKAKEFMELLHDMDEGDTRAVCLRLVQSLIHNLHRMHYAISHSVLRSPTYPKLTPTA